MPRPCTVCQHPDRPAIDDALVAGTESLIELSRQHPFSRAALDRHRRRHVPAALIMARQAGALADATTLADRVNFLVGEAQRLKDKAERRHDYRTAMAGIRELTRLLDLTLRLERSDAREETSRAVRTFAAAMEVHVRDRATLIAIRDTFVRQFSARAPGVTSTLLPPIQTPLQPDLSWVAELTPEERNSLRPILQRLAAREETL
jgi:hypothetical protein